MDRTEATDHLAQFVQQLTPERGIRCFRSLGLRLGRSLILRCWLGRLLPALVSGGRGTARVMLLLATVRASWNIDLLVLLDLVGCPTNVKCVDDRFLAAGCLHRKPV